MEPYATLGDILANATNVSPMHSVLHSLKEGRIIEAIKQFRMMTGLGLKEAKDAIEAIRDTFMPKDASDCEYVVISRHDYNSGSDHEVIRDMTESGAMADANAIFHHREEVLVAKVVAKTVKTKTLKKVA